MRAEETSQLRPGIDIGSSNPFVCRAIAPSVSCGNKGIVLS